jgi:pilus assembly protein Flp/PilA
MHLLRKLWRDEAGATAIEYGLIAALIAVAIIGVLSTLGGNLRDVFSEVADQLGTATSQ